MLILFYEYQAKGRVHGRIAVTVGKDPSSFTFPFCLLIYSHKINRPSKQPKYTVFTNKPTDFLSLNNTYNLLSITVVSPEI